VNPAVDKTHWRRRDVASSLDGDEQQPSPTLEDAIMTGTDTSSTASGPRTEFDGSATGQDVSVIIVDSVAEGVGPALHRHPYAETFVLVTGTVHFWVGDLDFVAVGPSVHIAPAYTPHRFTTVGSAQVHMVNIHASPAFITEWL
jgi:mannose-6-phosphate isomerase-like protein (cupin superfamily)